MSHIGIVGAGMAGAGAADALSAAGVDVTILEKSRGVGGRAATRRRNNCRYDHGANYVKGDDDGRTSGLVHELGEAGLVELADPVWTFGGDGEITASERDAETKYTWEAGITQFAKRLLARTDAEVRTSVRVASLARGDGWTATDETGDEHGPFDAVLLTPPAPQTADLLESTDWRGGWEEGALESLREAADAVPYRTIRTVVLNYGFELDVPWYGAVNTDDDHPVGWLSREECKPGHVPDGQTLLVAQMSPDWSVDHYDDDLADAADAAAARVATLVGDDRLREYDWADDQGWRYALPDEAADPSERAIERAREAGLFLAGDWVAGDGRVHEAVWNGVSVGEAMADRVE
ncbi:NAD(P)/FAD-dependent oxidoreductase [Candidatus Halobonum tyrrellensis]|uniref:Flavin-containing amine-oxidoreductase n=1 Tax=Candidatus Halobonum tyrrellensis G22 TaxID=1324957 RepID=V4GQX3_9EURY|nr:FAD-dependent oxidoreductase [Candidatus Halobonum tyrrellensis]ESP87451.1 flavin-containing amine-oxidoreductase [Candidatus Halobonum tyrrellensis G22]